MESDSTLAAIALAVSLGCFTLMAIGEASIGSLRRERLRDMLSQGLTGSSYLYSLHSLPMGPAGALTLWKVLSLPASLVSGLALVIASLGIRWIAIALVSLAILAFISFILIAARKLASRYGESISLKIAAPTRGLAWLLNPILAVAAALVQKASEGYTNGANGSREGTPSEIGLPLGSNMQPLDEHEVRMIRGVVRLDKTAAREIMVPRVDMVAAKVGTPISELAERMAKSGHSRVPVYSGDLDHIEGIAYARDVLDHMVQGEDTSNILVQTVVRDPLFIPESKTLEELLNEFQQRRMHMAIVIDEYGGVAGLVTIEDLLEEIVGEIQDEFDTGEPEIETVSETEFIMDAKVSIDQLNQLLSVTLEGDGFDTLGGFVYDRLGSIPSLADAVEYDGLRIEVVSTIGRRLKRLRVTKLSPHQSTD